METITPIQPLPWEGEELLFKAKKLFHYEELKKLKLSVQEQIKELAETIESHGTPTKPRQVIEQKLDKNKHRVLLLQLERIEKKMAELVESIRQDIDELKKETI